MTKLQLHYKIVDYKNGKVSWDSVSDSIDDYVKGLEVVKSISSNPDINEELPSDYEPYFGLCDVDGCENEGCSGGIAWRYTGYWIVCSKHSKMYREGKEQPRMKQKAIDKEKTRKPDGTLP